MAGHLLSRARIDAVARGSDFELRHNDSGFMTGLTPDIFATWPNSGRRGKIPD